MYYNSLEDIPLWNFKKVLKNGEFRWLLHYPEKYSEKINKRPCKEIWSIIYEDYFNNYGFTDIHKKLVKLQIAERKATINYLLSQKGVDETLMEVKRVKLKALTKRIEEKATGSEIESKINLQKYLGYPIDETKISAKEYFETIKVVYKQITVSNG